MKNKNKFISHYWRGLLIVLFIAVVIAGVWWVQTEQEAPPPEPKPIPTPLIQEIVKKNLREEYIPEAVTLDEMSSEQTIKIFTAWNVGEDSLEAYLVWDKNNNSVSRLAIMINIPYKLISDGDDANSLLSKYFLVDKKLECRNIDGMRFCNNVWFDFFERKEVGIVSPLMELNKTLVYLCIIPKSSKDYEIDTCVSFLSNEV